jgi:hypothetical protein
LSEEFYDYLSINILEYSCAYYPGLITDDGNIIDYPSTNTSDKSINLETSDFIISNFLEQLKNKNINLKDYKFKDSTYIGNGKFELPFPNQYIGWIISNEITITKDTKEEKYIIGFGFSHNKLVYIAFAGESEEEAPCLTEDPIFGPIINKLEEEKNNI